MSFHGFPTLGAVSSAAGCPEGWCSLYPLGFTIQNKALRNLD